MELGVCIQVLFVPHGLFIKALLKAPHVTCVFVWDFDVVYNLAVLLHVSRFMYVCVYILLKMCLWALFSWLRYMFSSTCISHLYDNTAIDNLSIHVGEMIVGLRN